MSAPKRFTYLGPEGTFTEAALLKLPEAQHSERVPANGVQQALDGVRDGEFDAAMVPIENSVEGGVSATLDAIAHGGALRIEREVLVPISFVLVGAPGMTLDRVRSVSTHVHAWAQCRMWVSENIPDAAYLPGASTAAAARALLDPASVHDAAICNPLLAERLGLPILGENIGDVEDAVTRFVLVGRPGALPEPTGRDKTTVVVPLRGDRPGALMNILDQFASRGVNLSRIESRPTGEFLGSYFFSLDVDGHIFDARVADALKGVHRLSPEIRFLGSYPRADEREATVLKHTRDEAFWAAEQWFTRLVGREGASGQGISKKAR